MKNNNNSGDGKKLDTFEVASQRRKDVLTVILIITTVIVVVMMINRFNEVNKLQSEIKELKQERSVNIAHNKKIEKQQNEQTKKIGLEQVTNNAITFDNKFFDWTSWGEYTDNMKQLQKDFPNLKENKNVDISGGKVGNGDSPISKHSSEEFTTKNQNEIAQLITQSKNTQTSKSEALWLKVSNYDNNQYDITKMNTYKEVPFD